MIFLSGPKIGKSTGKSVNGFIKNPSYDPVNLWESSGSNCGMEFEFPLGEDLCLQRKKCTLHT